MSSWTPYEGHNLLKICAGVADATREAELGEHGWVLERHALRNQL